MSVFNRPLLFSEVEKIIEIYLQNPQLSKALLVLGATGIGKTAAVNQAIKKMEMYGFPKIIIDSSVRVPNKKWNNIEEFIDEKLELSKNKDNRDIAAENGNHFIIESGLAVVRPAKEPNMVSIVSSYNEEEWASLSKWLDSSKYYTIVMGEFESNSNAFADEWIKWVQGVDVNVDDEFIKEIETWFGV